jgi:spore coat polysaccharide biosynthesis protein SpsF
VKTVVVVQARMGSTRLPGKVMMPLAGAPLLARMLERLQAASTPSELVVATTGDTADDVIVDLCRASGTRVFRGHPTDLLERHYEAAREAGADVVVKIPSDCPLVDPAIIDRVIGTFLASPSEHDFVSNLHPATWPDGNDVEVMPMELLALAHAEAKRPHEREHTTPFLWDQPHRFRIGNVAWETGRDLSATHRFTIDYPEDYTLIRTIYEALYRPDRPVFSLREILSFLEAHPDILRINERYNGVIWYRHHLDELRTVSPGNIRSPA